MKKRRHKHRIQAAGSECVYRIECAQPVEFVEVEAAEGEAAKPPRFKMLAYSGVPMTPMSSRQLDAPIVIDLAGMSVPKAVPILRDHASWDLVGQTTRIDLKAKSLTVEGVITGDVADAKSAAGAIVAHARAGFQWSASIGATAGKIQEVPRGSHVVVNGRRFDGPVMVARSSRLREVSFVPLGADENASAQIAAGAAKGREVMGFEAWLKNEFGLEASALSDAQRARFMEKFEASQGDPGDEDDGKSAVVQAREAIRSATAAEVANIAALRKACEGNDELLVKALAENWSVDKATAEALKVKLASVSIQARRPDATPAESAVTIEAALRLGSSEPRETVEKEYKPETLDAASKIRNLGVKSLVALACRLDGRPTPELTEGHSAWIAAAFSTNTVPNLLSTAANKSLLAGYRSTPAAFRTIARKLSPNDFKTHTGYRANSDGGFTEIAPGQKIEYGGVKEEMSFNYRVKTFAKLIGITLQDWRNDDLSVFTDIPRLMGRDAARKVEEVGWAMHTANVASGGFIDSDLTVNYMAGADTVLSLASLGVAEKKMLESVDSNGKPVVVQGKYLAVAPANFMTARTIYQSPVLIGGVDPAEPSQNVLAGAYEPLLVRDFATAVQWTLFSDPSVEAAYGVAYLDGNEQPTVEEVPVSPEYLGRLWRAVLHFGTCNIEPLALQYSKGAA